MTVALGSNGADDAAEGGGAPAAAPVGMTAVASEGPDPVGITPVASSSRSKPAGVDACGVPHAVQNLAPAGSAAWQLLQIRSLNPTPPSPSVLLKAEPTSQAVSHGSRAASPQQARV